MIIDARDILYDKIIDEKSIGELKPVETKFDVN